MGRGVLRLTFLLIGVMPLSACGDFVRSKQPLFYAVDEVGVVPLRQGVWSGREPGCAFDEAEPIDRWPSCAVGIHIGRRGLKDPALKLKIDRVAAGDPMILQIVDDDDAGYSYAAMEVRERDRRGRATEVAVWPVMCGPGSTDVPAVGDAAPTPARPDAPQDAAASPRVLFPGLTADGRDCLATEASAVRNAAVLSRPKTRPAAFRWLRAGRR